MQCVCAILLSVVCPAVQLFFFSVSHVREVSLVRFELHLNFINSFSNYSQISNFVKILSVGAECFRADRRTDRRDEDNSRFSQFCDCA